MAYQGFMYGASGQRIYPTPREFPGKYRNRGALQRDVKKQISQYDHAELVSLSASLACRIPSLRAAIRDKNAWSFSNWLPIYMGEDETWGEGAEEYLLHEVLPNAFFRELRPDFAWGLRISGMGLDMHGDDLAVFTEDEAHNPKIHIAPGPLIGNNQGNLNQTVYGNTLNNRGDGMSEVKEGRFKGCGIYNGMIRQGNRWVAVRVIGFDSRGNSMFTDIDLGPAAHYACEAEFFGQGRGTPRIAASVLHWMNKEEIDDQFLKGLKNAAQRAVVHKLAKGQDAHMALGNAIQATTTTVINSKTGEEEEEEVFVQYTPDGNVAYIGSDEELGGISFENPHPNAEAFAIRVLVECLADLGWSWALTDTSMVSRAPTRLETEKANNAICERQSIEEIRSVRFFQHSIAKGMELGRIPKNRNGFDPYKWGIGFPKEMSVDQGNDAKSAIERLRMGLTNERIEAAKEGLIAKRINRDREKEIIQKLTSADRAFKFAQTLGHKEFTFDQAMALFIAPANNAPQKPNEKKEEKKPEPAAK